MGRRTIINWIAVICASVAAVALSPLAYSMLLNQSLTYTTRIATNDSLAVNYIVALYLYGWWIDKISKRIGKKRAWLLWGVGMVVILFTLKYVFGWESRW